MKKNILFIFLLTFFNGVTAQDVLDEGLYFSSHEVTQEQRTSLNLTPNYPLEIDQKLVVEFEANFRRGDGYYGNIVQLIGDKKTNIDLVANLNHENENFWLVVKDKILFKYKWADIPRGSYDKWIKFKIEINAKHSEITISINGYKLSKDIEGISKMDVLDIIFGKSRYKGFVTTDVCPMSIKNVKILDNNNALIKNWPLGKHTKKNKVYDNISNDEALVENPKWLIDQHVFWKKIQDFNFNNLLGTANDPINKRVYFINPKSIYIYHIDNNTIDTLNQIRNTINCQSANYKFNHLSNELLAYSIDEGFYQKFDFKKQQWSESKTSCPETAYFHHNKIISPIDSTLLTFGGYGFYKYKSQISNFSFGKYNIQSLDLSSQVPPRYLSSMGLQSDNKLLLFGGYGSPSGKQGVRSRHFYDLYSIDLNNNYKTNKLWETDNIPYSPFVPVSSMIIDENTDSFYTLTYNNTNYNTNLKLAQIGVSSPKVTVFSDSIPYEFLDIKSHVDFFLDSNNSKIHTLTVTESKASLYSLTYPPLFPEDIYQNEIEPLVLRKNYWIYALFGLILIFISIFLIRKRLNKPNRKVKTTDAPALNEEILELTHVKPEKVKTSAIYLYGGFQVYDKEGNDITALFTPTLKQLFLIILLTSAKNGKGISSNQLTELLWPNKSDSNARNNRNVNISKLRLLLDKIGNIEISNDNTYWNINLGNSVFCDFTFVQEALDENANKHLDHEQTYKLLNIISKGEISPDVHTEWIEDFKNDDNNMLIDNLIRIAKYIDDAQLLILLSNIILKYAPLNEDAISIKCKSLYNQGKKGIAKKNYNDFCQKYFELLEADYEKSFKETISDFKN
ncbi:hypothetical protein KFZ70_12440 [Tamlana fucoidanivorans]|uniref:Galactose oxidase n=1 Tax=Allotamlana fucoidanivorans TaxID=2583814 RepID=A0A5C4SMI9_9FLAO|nr:hypothetical protein [Tamlana fucoidanivorans]TNJ44921.1 hypothetical protein FGF67_07085 [Tamlana fucoidanivorans]